MRVKYEYAGSEPVAQGLKVYLEVVTGSTKRVKTILIPWSEFDDTNVLHEIDRAVRTRLKDLWSRSSESTAYLPWD